MTGPDRKAALVTGAGRNIGRDIALALATSGVEIAVNDRASVDKGHAVVEEILAVRINRGAHLGG